MFDKTFVKFTLGFIAVIALGLFTLYTAGYLKSTSVPQTASASSR
jgi:hypothetical protein